MVEGGHLLTASSSIPSSAPALEEEKPTYMLSYMTRLLLFQKVESNGGPFLKCPHSKRFRICMAKGSRESARPSYGRLKWTLISRGKKTPKKVFQKAQGSQF